MWGQSGGGWGGGWGGGQDGGQQPEQRQQRGWGGFGGGGMFRGLMARLQQQPPMQRGGMSGPFGNGARPPMAGGAAGGPGQSNFAPPTPDARMAQAQNLQAENAAYTQNQQQNAGYAAQAPAPQGGMQAGRMESFAGPAGQAPQQQLQKPDANQYGRVAPQGAPIFRKQDEQY